MNVQQTMEDVHQMQNVQILWEVSFVLVILGIMEMVSHVMVIIFDLLSLSFSISNLTMKIKI